MNFRHLLPLSLSAALQVYAQMPSPTVTTSLAATSAAVTLTTTGKPTLVQCGTLTPWAEQEKCSLSLDGWNSVAANYLATAMAANGGAASSAWYHMYTDPDYFYEANRYYYGPSYSSNKVTGLVTFDVAHATAIADPRLRSSVTSILLEALVLQNNPNATVPSVAAAPAPAPTRLSVCVAAGVVVAVAGLAIGL